MSGTGCLIQLGFSTLRGFCETHENPRGDFAALSLDPPLRALQRGSDPYSEATPIRLRRCVGAAALRSSARNLSAGLLVETLLDAGFALSWRCRHRGRRRLLGARGF